MVYAGILAGGRGERMGHTQRPKQFLPIGGRPILIHTVERFLKAGCIDRVLVAVPAKWMDYTKVLLGKYLPKAAVSVVEGGEDRNDSLLRVCGYIEKAYGLHEEDILVSHDAVRPFVSARILEENVRFAREVGAANTMLPAIDTIATGEGEFLDTIPPRELMYQVQTPQSFRMAAFIEVCRSLTEREAKTLTDASKIYRLKGLPVKIVVGEQRNFKITTPYDLAVADFLCKTQSAAGED